MSMHVGFTTALACKLRTEWRAGRLWYRKRFDRRKIRYLVTRWTTITTDATRTAAQHFNCSTRTNCRSCLHSRKDSLSPVASKLRIVYCKLDQVAESMGFWYGTNLFGDDAHRSVEGIFSPYLPEDMSREDMSQAHPEKERIIRTTINSYRGDSVLCEW